ncbi:zinc finger protein 654 [Rhincodon typus]|uniref:zinc finger protein 654 n=1 Tax=Rhincodon typus TaxID=259920 RepID=UPI00202FF75D|nr:zinc finger protein 654 [Rhincodon typus]
MAEEEEFDVGSLRKELEWIENELRMSLGQVSASNEYCLKFCRVTEWHAGRWQVPLPLVHVLKSAICCFTKARPFLAPECEHIQYVLSRLALSCFEVLLYCIEDDSSKGFWEEFLKTIQECHNVLQNDLNAEFDVLIRLSRNGGPWQNPVLVSILNQELVTQELVNEYLGSESPVFFEYRVKYLMKYKHVGEAITLTKYCVNHPQTGTNKYFLHLFLTWLCRSSPEEVLLQEIARIDCQEALDVICRLDSEGQVELAWILCVAFLTQQLRNGDMYCTRELILVWSKLQLQLDSSKQHFLEKCRHLLLTSRNVNHIFLFIRVIQNEVGTEGLQFCVELCARALRIDYQDEPNTKTLVCKTLSYLLPNDLDFCRACTITVFFSECTLESFHAVESLYSQPDQLYTEDTSLVPSFLRCELLLVLKTTWPFDPEFWDWRILKKSCLALIRNKVALTNAHGCKLVSKHGDNLSSNGNSKIKNKEKHNKMPQLIPGASRADGHLASMHRCMLCKKEFLGGHIVRHAQVHPQKGAFSCLICARKFRLRGQMLKHLKTHVRKLQKQKLAARTNTNESSTVIDGLQETCTHINGVLDSENRPVTSETASVDEQSKFRKLTGDKDNKISIADVPDEWYKGKCRYCQRKFTHSQHLIDHLKRHQYPKLYFCLQCGCSQTFKSASELATHTKGHEAFRAQCSFRDCDKLFDELDVLYEHEAQHYLSGKPIRLTEHDKKNSQTSKVLSHREKASEDECLRGEQNPMELLVPLWKSRKELSEPKTYLHNMVSKQSGNQNGDGKLNDTLHISVESDEKTLPVESGSENCCINNKQIINGHINLKDTLSELNPTNPFYSGDTSSDGVADLDKTCLTRDASNSESTPAVLNNSVSKGAAMDVSQNASNLSQQSNVHPALQASSSQEQKISSGREEHKGYGRLHKYYRPQPPSYLDERYISMPKRRKLATDSNQPPSSHANAINVKNERHICRKCFMIFNSIEALEGHSTRDNCRPLFVMESDSD